MSQTHYRLSDVSTLHVGKMIKRSISTAVIVGHENPQDTIRDYFHPQSVDGEFLQDYVLLGKGEISLRAFVKKWEPDLEDILMKKYA